MKKGTRKILSVLVGVVIAFGAFVSFEGLDPIQKLSDKMKYGLDINGGVYVLLEADTNKKGTDLTKLMDQTKSVLENRVNAMGISEASVSIEGSNRVRVEMPGVEDAQEAINQIGKTAQLRLFLADGTEVMRGNDITDSSFTNDTNNGGYKITIDFSSAGSDAFAEATEKAASGAVTAKLKDENGNTVDNTAIVIMLDDEVISAPTVSEKISSRSCEITRSGGFSEDEASSTSALIRGGALPATLTEVSSSVETATIGANALSKCIVAGLIGLGIVMLIMIAAYGMLGIIADVALILYVELTLWIMALLGSVLTLPGIAAIILSIGMAVDSNVIIFTRIREEIEKGKTIRVAVDSGFKSALSTVVDSQTTTLIAAIVLYLIGTTSVKGFALTLMIGTLCSIFTAVFITQLFVTTITDIPALCKMRHFGMHEDGTPRMKWRKFIHFIDNRKKCFTFSLIIIVLGFGFAMVRGFNYGIDFTGGTMIQLEMGQKVDSEEVKDIIGDYDLDPTIVYASDNQSQIVIRTKKALNADKRAEVVSTISEKYNLKDDAVLASEEFGPTVGKELRHNAIKAIIIASFCMLVYIRFRFKTWKYGVAAVGGLLHDVLFTLAMYAIFGFSINNPFIAGILTVVGYSINDTIVIFDRIRENKRYYKRKELVRHLDTSVNETLSRSIMTSLTTLIVMVPLYIMVSTELREFLIPLIIGVTCGTYSSIFICTPLLYEMSKNESKSRYELQREKKAKAAKSNSGIVK